MSVQWSNPVNNDSLSLTVFKLINYAEIPKYRQNDNFYMTMCIQINVLGLCVMTREFIKQLRERGVDDGHVILNRCIMSVLVPAFNLLLCIFRVKNKNLVKHYSIHWC